MRERRSRWRGPATRAFVSLTALAALWLAGCGGPGRSLPPNPRNVLLISLDTCRPDMLGCYEEEGGALTPRLDRLAAGGVLFEGAFCQAPTTLPSHASILTGLTPLRHGIHDNGVYFLGEEFTTLAEILDGHDYLTAAFVSAFVLDHRFGLDQGFSLYDDRMEEALKAGGPPRFRPEADPLVTWWLSRWFSPYQRRADQVSQAAIDWLREEAEHPFFLWVHYFDPHEPYTPPDPWVDRYDPDYSGAMNGHREPFMSAVEKGEATGADFDHMVARYRGEVSFTDEWTGRLLDVLDELDLMEETLVLVVGDHGEGLGEHNLFFEHNALIYEELVRVPMLLRFPGNEHGGSRISSLVRTTDLLPTVVEYLGLDAPPDLEGKSLLPLLRREEEEDRETYLEALCSRQALPAPVERRGMRTSRWKFIRTIRRADSTSTLELYDLGEDPGETRNLTGEGDSLAAAWETRLDDLLRTAPAGAAPSAHTRELDPETREKLRALGYLR